MIYDPDVQYTINPIDKENYVSLMDLPPEELDKFEKGIFQHRYELRFQQKLAEDVSPHIWKKMRKDIARIKTLRKWRNVI